VARKKLLDVRLERLLPHFGLLPSGGQVCTCLIEVPLVPFRNIVPSLYLAARVVDPYSKLIGLSRPFLEQ
jgi:hypothetical protein